MIKCPDHTCIVLIFCHADLRIFPHLWNQILHQRLFQPRPDVRFLFHDAASENHRLRVYHITDIGDSKCQNIRSAGQFLPYRSDRLPGLPGKSARRPNALRSTFFLLFLRNTRTERPRRCLTLKFSLCKPQITDLARTVGKTVEHLFIY